MTAKQYIKRIEKAEARFSSITGQRPAAYAALIFCSFAKGYRECRVLRSELADWLAAGTALRGSVTDGEVNVYIDPPLPKKAK